MIEVDSFALRNVVHFNEAVVPVTQNNGLVIVSGHNKDSLVAKDQNNGAGKSLLLSAIPNCRYAAAPSSTSKNTKKDMLDSSKSEIEVNFRNNQGQQIQFIQKPSKWIISEEEDGDLKNIEARTTAIQQEKMALHFPLSQEEFYAYTYLSSIQGQRLHFQVEKPADRLHFITSIFQLDAYDRLKQYFTRMLSTIKDEQTKFDVLESKLLHINTQLERVNWTDKDQTRIRSARSKFDALQTERKETSRIVSDLERKLYNLKHRLKQVNKIESLLEKHSFQNKDLEQEITKLSTRKKTINAYLNYLHQLSSYEKSISRIQKRIDELSAECPDKSAEHVESALRKTKDTLEQHEKQLQTKRETNSAIAQLRKRIDAAVDQIKETQGDISVFDLDMETDIEEDISVYRTTLKLKKLADSDVHQCPTCHQSVDIAQINKSVQTAKKKLKKLEALRDARELRKKIDSWHESLQEYESDDSSQTVQQLQKRLDQDKEKTEKLQGQLRALRTLQDSQDNLDALEKPKTPTKVPPSSDPEVLQSTLKEYETRIEAARRILDLQQDVKMERPEKLESRIEVLDQDLKQNKQSLDKIDARYASLSKTLSDLDLRKGEYRVLHEQQLSLEQELEQIRPLLDKYDLYKALEKAYSSKGLKVRKANERARMIEANLNRYSNLIFAEAFTFSVYATEKGVFCDVDRNNGKTSDVRLMSGSESDSFRLLFMLSLLLLVPSDRRTNMAILDEPDSHMDDRTRTLFAERFLPFLRSVVPHVFVITPKDHHIFNDYESWKVVKEGGVSYLQQE